VTTPLDQSERRALRKKARAATLDALRALGGEDRREVIIARALADGGFTPRELGAPVPEGATTPYTGLAAYKLSFALSDLKSDGLLENPDRGVWRLAGAALEMPASAVDELISEARLAELRAMPYPLYLKTPEWRRTRAAALLRAGNACSLDMTHTDGLEVHHRTYERLGAELVTDLAVLCHSCHQLHHNEYGHPRREQSPAPPPLRAVTDDLVATSQRLQAAVSVGT
jgi:hypothetical protein